MIQERDCPRCGIRRTVRQPWSVWSFCFNCKLQWSSSIAATARESEACPVSTAYPFSPTELTRLTVYRRAVRAGFFSDWR
jgi:hypothetical protein